MKRATVEFLHALLGIKPMSPLDHPEAQALLADAVLIPGQVRGCQDRLTVFLERYLPRSYRAEQRATASLVIGGLLSDLQRKTCEPIAVQAGVHRKPIQFFVGAGKWDDEVVMAELRRHVAEELADDRAVLVIDGSTFPKTGTESCGVARQWCRRLGKQENCQIGVFLTYAAPVGYAPLDRRLDRPEDWADTAGSRVTTSWAARPTSAPGFAEKANGTCSTCPATRSSATWSAAGYHAGVRAEGPSGRCRSMAGAPTRRCPGYISRAIRFTPMSIIIRNNVKILIIISYIHNQIVQLKSHGRLKSHAAAGALRSQAFSGLGTEDADAPSASPSRRMGGPAAGVPLDAAEPASGGRDGATR